MIRVVCMEATSQRKERLAHQTNMILLGAKATRLFLNPWDPFAWVTVYIPVYSDSMHAAFIIHQRAVIFANLN